MNNFSIIEANDVKWTDIVKKSFQYDFYHTQSYHLLEKNSRPILCVATFENEFIALPLIVRSIPNTNLFDCTSAYGYCGPISSMDFDKINQEIFDFFKKNLLKYFKENKIVTVFSRLHPLISNGIFFDNFGELKDINKTVAIDLKLSPEEQKKQYRRTNKSELNQLRRKGYEVMEANSKEEIDIFVNIYHETMSRVDASSNYFFDHDYFYKFLNNDCFDNKLLLAKKDGIITAGAIFTITGKIMQYHLAGTAEAYMKETPMKLILDEARLLGNYLSLDFLHLGGGVGGSDEDSLFRFKSGFSDFRCNYRIWQMIVDEQKNLELVIQTGADKENNFFPLYRSIK